MKIEGVVEWLIGGNRSSVQPQIAGGSTAAVRDGDKELPSPNIIRPFFFEIDERGWNIWREANKRSLGCTQIVSGNPVGFKHSVQLQTIDRGDHDPCNQRPESNKRIGWLVDGERIFDDLSLVALWIAVSGYVGRRFIRHSSDYFWSVAFFLLLAVSAAHIVRAFLHLAGDVKSVAQKYQLTSHNYCNTLIAIGRLNLMANALNTDKQARAALR